MLSAHAGDRYLPSHIVHETLRGTYVGWALCSINSMFKQLGMNVQPETTYYRRYPIPGSYCYSVCQENIA